ncbi:MAG TPA: PDZ domain-containing protein [Candidatus Polarisedimenticolaceae bacterium]|nr:PDZ domain-containing protein [Candidatus Polarisedimenticolaceae bacterium]
MRRVLMLLLALLVVPASHAQDDPLAPARAKLESAAFEQAIRELDKVIAGDVPPEVRLDARVLRAQALVALGDTKKAEAEWTAILQERPGFRPDPAAVPAKAMKRFDAVRAAKVGTVRLDLDPQDAALAVDGKPAVLDADGTLPVLAGAHTLRAERSGFDPAEATVAVTAGASVDLPLRLSPNARSVLVQAEPAGAEVFLDGQSMGRVEVPAGGGTPALLLRDLPLGEHAFEVRLACYRTAHADELLNVDLLDRAPKHLGPFRLERAQGTLAPSGLDGATLSVDGKRVGVLPLDPFVACAGTRRVEAARAGRRLWSGTVEVHEGEPLKLVLMPRPTLALAGGDPPAWAEAWSVETGDPPPESVDLLWSGGEARSPQLDVVVPSDDPLLSGPPLRGKRTIGVGLADAEPWGMARIVRLRKDGPAARAGVRLGERIAAIGGKPVRSTKEAEASIAAAGEGALELTLEAGAGESRKVSVTPAITPVLLPPPADKPQAALRLAWAAAEAAARPDDVAAAADLVLALAAAGRTQAAAEAWRSRTWPARSGISKETVEYFLGRALQRAGDAASAGKVLAEAAASRATAESDDGPAIAPAAKSP